MKEETRLEAAFGFWQFIYVNAAVAEDDLVTGSFAAKAARQTLQLWVSFCNEFRQRERHDIIEQKPSP